MNKELLKEVVEGKEYKVKYQVLLNYLKFQIEKETYISTSDLKRFIDGLEPMKEGELNE